MNVVAVIQARMGSTRLPGKMMLTLGEAETITHVIRRTTAATKVDSVVLAIPEQPPDLLLADRAQREGILVFQGDEADVLSRIYSAAKRAEADIVIRIAGDCPAVSPEIIDHAVGELFDRGADYVSNKMTRTFPLGLDVEVFTLESFATVEKLSDQPAQREHVTLYYQDHPDDFRQYNFVSHEIFQEGRYQNRTDIELVLDEAQDYLYLDRIFSALHESEPDVRKIIDFIDEHGLMDEISEVQRNVRKNL